MWIGLLAVLGLTAAQAADDPGLWIEQTGAVAIQPGGLLSGTAVEYRAPVMRYGGVMSNMTYAGVGARLTATPAFAEAAARASFMPLDVLPIRVEAVFSEYWRSPFGMLGYDRQSFLAGTQGPIRNSRYGDGEGFAGQMWSIVVSPTFQIKFGPVVGFTNWTGTFLKIIPQRDVAEPWVFEPYRGMVVGFEDTLVEHTSALLFEAMDGQEGPLLRVGVLSRGKYSRATPDVSLQVGAGAQYKPTTSRNIPTLLLVVTPYVQDPDLVGPIPFTALLATWEWEPRKGDAPQ